MLRSNPEHSGVRDPSNYSSNRVYKKNNNNNKIHIDYIHPSKTSVDPMLNVNSSCYI